MRRTDIREIGVERNEEQKRAYDKMVALHGINILIVFLGLWVCDYVIRSEDHLYMLLLAFSSPLVIFAILAFFCMASDFYEKSITATLEQLQEYARKNNKYVGKTWFEDDEEV